MANPLAEKSAGPISEETSGQPDGAIRGAIRAEGGEHPAGWIRLFGAPARIEGRRPALILTSLTLAICCLMFPPLDWGWLGHVCLVPWLICVATSANARFVYFLSWLLGLGYFLVHIRWMIPVTGPGYAALCGYFALFFPLAAWPIRHMYQRYRLSMALTVAVVWTAAEYLRSIGTLAFPWVLLGHTQYRFLAMIQISDLAGVYGVSFVVALINGWFADLFLQPILIWRPNQLLRFPLSSALLLLVLGGTLAYGAYRLSTQRLEPGPRVAVVQHDFPMYVDEELASRIRSDTVMFAYLELTREAARQKPDLIVLPETAMHGYVNEEFLTASPEDLDNIQRRRFPSVHSGAYMAMIQRESRQFRDAFQRLCDASGVPIVLGSLAMEWKPTAIPPRAEAYNSAFLLVPNKAVPQARYDKNHLVLFGEYVPFRYTYHWLYKWLNSITPWGRNGIEYSLGAGSGFQPIGFEAASRGGKTYRAGTMICYEEIMPYIGRAFARTEGRAADAKGVDLLLSISNDGWFLHSAELEQHLAAGVFRAVENRVGVARSVNTGASGFILPSGRIVDCVELPPEKIALLGPVEATLRSLLDLMDGKAAPLAAEDWSQTFVRVVNEQLRPRVQALGPAFEFIAERQPAEPPQFPAEISAKQRMLARWRGGLIEDIETVARWRRRPSTAPGVSTSDMKIDPRVTLYTRWGDWFARTMAVLSTIMLADGLLRRALGRIGSADRLKEAPA